VLKGMDLTTHEGKCAQWINCDLRFFDLTILGKFDVVLADPPWDIHMNVNSLFPNLIAK